MRPAFHLFHNVAHDGWPGGEGLQVAGKAAGAGRTVRIDDHVPELGGQAVEALHQLIVHDHAAADRRC